jgi:Staphylococcal nuclease homologue
MRRPSAQKTGKGVILTALLLASGPALSDPCAPAAETGESVTISVMRDDNRLTLADGRVVQIAGLDLASLRLPALAGREAVLVTAGPPDRHGAIHAGLYVEGEDLALALAAEGKARIRPAPGEEACYGQLMTAEDNARKARLGLWADPGYAVADAAVPESVSRYADAFAILTGRIQHIGMTKATVWIDFGSVWREDVTLAVPRRQWPRFEAAGLTEAALAGNVVRARGVVTMRGGPRIDITEPAAIERVASDRN